MPPEIASATTVGGLPELSEPVWRRKRAKRSSVRSRRFERRLASPRASPRSSRVCCSGESDRKLEEQPGQPGMDRLGPASRPGRIRGRIRGKCLFGERPAVGRRSPPRAHARAPAPRSSSRCAASIPRNGSTMRTSAPALVAAAARSARRRSRGAASRTAHSPDRRAASRRAVRRDPPGASNSRASSARCPLATQLRRAAGRDDLAEAEPSCVRLASERPEQRDQSRHAAGRPSRPGSRRR